MGDEHARRRTLHVGPQLRAMIESGRVAGRSVSERVDRMAGRYAALIAAQVPARWPVSDWLSVIAVMRGLTIVQPGDAAVLTVRLKQLGKGAPGADFGGLTYRLDALKLPELLALVDVAERAIADGAVDAETLPAWLADQGIQS